MVRKLESVCSIQTDFINCVCICHLSFASVLFCYFPLLLLLLCRFKTQDRGKLSISNQIKVKFKLEEAFTGEIVTFPNCEYYLL